MTKKNTFALDKKFGFVKKLFIKIHMEDWPSFRLPITFIGQRNNSRETGSFCEQISVFEYFFLSSEGGFCELMRFEYLFICEVNGLRK